MNKSLETSLYKMRYTVDYEICITNDMKDQIFPLNKWSIKHLYILLIFIMKSIDSPLAATEMIQNES